MPGPNRCTSTLATPRGAQSLAAADVGAALTAVREAAPGMPVGISTGGWIAPGGPARLAPMRTWKVLPDYVSVNIHEPEAEAIVALMQARGIGVEAGIWTRAAAARFVASRTPRYSLRILVEMTAEDPEAATAEAEAVLGTLADAGIAVPILLHGEGGSVWPMVRMAARARPRDPGRARGRPRPARRRRRREQRGAGGRGGADPRRARERKSVSRHRVIKTRDEPALPGRLRSRSPARAAGSRPSESASVSQAPSASAWLSPTNCAR